MAKEGADIKNPKQGQGGFASDNSNILGFSHMHDSGTGGVRNFSFNPTFYLKLELTSDSHYLWEISLYSPKLDVREIILITVSFSKTND
jgi:hypothetical protein